jgi:alpha-ketoglutarate-dependent taurine dioxygenase
MTEQFRQLVVKTVRMFPRSGPDGALNARPVCAKIWVSNCEGERFGTRIGGRVVVEDAALLPDVETMKPRAWRAVDVGPESSWRWPLLAGSAGATLELARTLASGLVPLVETQLAAHDRLAWSSDFAPLADALENGRGFAILERPSAESLSLQVRLALYWIIGQILGEPVAQNVEGVRLYDVRDQGQSLSQGVRFSVTNYESTFHTDASFEDAVVDYVGLLCVQTAKSGGWSQLVSGYSAAVELAAARPAVLEVLASPFHVDRRGGVRPGETTTTRHPVLARQGDEILYRYLRTWIEVGHQKAGEPLSGDQLRALDALDSTLRRGDLRLEFMLRPGEMLWLNNRWILHNRTAFEDHTAPERRRHYVRLWLRRRTEQVPSSL